MWSVSVWPVSVWVESVHVGGACLCMGVACQCVGVVCRWVEPVSVWVWSVCVWVEPVGVWVWSVSVWVEPGSVWVETPALLSGLKSSGCTLTASLTADTPFPVAGEAAMMAYATPGPAEACWPGPPESGPPDGPCGGAEGGEASLWPLGWWSGLKVLLAVGRVGPWLLGLTTAVALCRLRGCSS